jgi:hypothetical protein
MEEIRDKVGKILKTQEEKKRHFTFKGKKQ